MATCASLITELNAIQAEALSISSSWNSTLRGIQSAASANDLAGAEAGLRELNGFATKVNNLADMIDDRGAIADLAEELNCPDAIAKSNQVSQILFQLTLTLRTAVKSGETAVNTVRAAVNASQSASEKTNNAGTGKPGTAGTGANASPPPASPQPPPVTTEEDAQAADNPPVPQPQKTPTEEDAQAADNPPVPQSQKTLTEEEIQQQDNQPSLTEEEIQQQDNPGGEGSSSGLTGAEFDVQAQATAQDQANFQAREDWRVRLTLAPDATYLYRASEPGILSPLADTDGVVFPYTPLINVTYSAAYDAASPTHSNYKIFQYTNSSVDNVTITCDFTAQDTYEANYLLAVIHFFRSATKMFYGQDEYPKNGTPPPLVYMFGMGGFQFEAHPLAITGFTYNLPNDVDYIKTTTSSDAGAEVYTYSTGTSTDRLPENIQPGGTRPSAKFDTGAEETTTWVPTKIQLSITCVPIISRNAISNKFSFKEYATGRLLQGIRNVGGGIW